jgi:precorrin-8X/cobalt-precorrin-8 methylmutase
MTTSSYVRDGAEIYRRSFAIIRAEAELSRFPAALEPAVVRMIHACGMVDLVDDIDFSAEVGTAVRAALQEGAAIVADSRMVADGITRARLPAQNEVCCAIGDPAVAARAVELGTTRAAAAVDHLRDRLGGAVVVVGNAPTALFRIMDLLDEGCAPPAGVVGVPVGFVGAAESKRALASRDDVPWLTVHGRRGGSAIAASAVNALAGDPE